MSNCKFCNNTLSYVFADLGTMPSANAFIKKDGIETYFPLRVYVCEKCMLVQALEFESPENIFSEYSYFSSISQSWLNHCKEYCEQIINKFSFDSNSFIIEIASNDGYLLKNFVDKSIKVLGIEPAKNIASDAEKKGVPTLCAFFGAETAGKVVSKYGKADLLLGNNVYAHAPDINDFTKGLKILLKENGIITLEFPSLLNLINEGQFDTIYNEHVFYLSLIAVKNIFNKHGLRIFNIENLSTHGGSLRIYACHPTHILMI